MTEPVGVKLDPDSTLCTSLCWWRSIISRKRTTFTEKDFYVEQNFEIYKVKIMENESEVMAVGGKYTIEQRL
jgi:hypothetical protein